MKRLLPDIALLLLVAAQGLPAISGDFVSDDLLYVVHNPHVFGRPTPSEILTSAFPPWSSTGLHRPVTTASWRLDHEAGGGGTPRPLPFRISNMVLAGAVAVLVHRLLRRLVAPAPAFLAAALFASHPTHVEVVAWISGRSEILAALFTVSLLIVGSSRLRPGPAALPALILAFLAAGSKETGYVAPIFLALMPRRRDGPPDPRRKTVLVIAAAAGAAVAFALRCSALASTGPMGHEQVLRGVPFGERALIGLLLAGRYVRWAIFPHPLLIDHDDRLIRLRPLLSDPSVPLLATAAVAITIFALIRRRRTLRFGLVTAIAALGPVLHVAWPIGEGFAERFLYLPSVGLAAAVSSGLAVVPRRASRTAAGVVAALVVACGTLSIVRSLDYRSQRSLFEAQAAGDPDNPMSHVHLGKTLANEAEALHGTRPAAAASRLAASAAAFDRALAIDGDLAPALIDRARLHDIAGATGAALRLLDRAADLHPGDPWVVGARGAVLARAGRREEALRDLEKAGRLNPEDELSWWWRAFLVNGASGPDRAAAVLDAGLRLRPASPVLLEALAKLASVHPPAVAAARRRFAAAERFLPRETREAVLWLLP